MKKLMRIINPFSRCTNAAKLRANKTELVKLSNRLFKFSNVILKYKNSFKTVGTKKKTKRKKSASASASAPKKSKKNKSKSSSSSGGAPKVKYAKLLTQARDYIWGNKMPLDHQKELYNKDTQFKTRLSNLYSNINGTLARAKVNDYGPYVLRKLAKKIRRAGDELDIDRNWDFTTFGNSGFMEASPTVEPGVNSDIIVGNGGYINANNNVYGKIPDISNTHPNVVSINEPGNINA